ncbi:hypothetical protein QJS10_CPB11g00741 [Acorus calamus]|uniref:Uncharacterized protein n=1 Tax=Acorus calamus TaxID=4465 RepID=A0AAV9DR97_ACOCL|nr:hypothetical protein QJS10_CPB11g00741 [Acorus calamus]
MRFTSTIGCDGPTIERPTLQPHPPFATHGESLEDIREALCGLNGVSWPHQGISGFPQLPCSTNVQIHQDGNALLLNRCWAPILISANGLDRRALSGVEFMLPVFNGNMNLNFNLNHKKL